MSHLSPPDSDYRQRFGAQSTARLAMTLLMVVVIVGTNCAFGESLVGWGRRTFVSPDVALVSLLSSLPFVLSVSLFTRRRPGNQQLLVFACCGIVVALLVVTSSFGNSVEDKTFAWLSLERAAFMLGVSMTAAIPLLLVRRATEPERKSRPAWSHGLRLGLGVLIAVMLPAVYIHARYRHDVVVIDDLVEQSRLGEALVLAQELAALMPPEKSSDDTLSVKRRAIERQVRLLESEVANFTADRSETERLRNCQQLAMLGRTDEALSRLVPLLDSDIELSACELCGVIHEKKSQWTIARDYHRRAKDQWRARSTAAQHQTGLAQAAARLGYCERKLGNHEAAETEYRELLEIAPTAENHFLAAQFYEDIQHSTKARLHARQAMTLGSRRYEREGTNLINRLVVGHFGCLSVFADEQSSDTR